jgi:Flp pilus assembly protein TadB/Mg-chelatase subunit ChlD
VRRAVLALLAAALVLPGAAGAASSVQIRRVDLDKFPLVRVTTVVPKGSRPTLAEEGRRAGFVRGRELGSAEAMVLAVDNSASMSGRPLRQAKRAAAAFLARQSRTGDAGLVAFGHEALALTQPRDTKSDVARSLASLAPDSQKGTALYDGVVLSVERLEGMSTGSRVLVLLTDGHDLGSRSSLAQAIASAQRANVTVFAIAAGGRTDLEPLRKLASATGGRLFRAANPSGLGSAYRSLGRELDRTWQLSYFSQAREGDRVDLTVRAKRAASTASVRIPDGDGGSGLLPGSVARSPITAAAFVLLAALLLAGAGAVGRGRRRSSEIARLLEPHLRRRDTEDESPRRFVRFDSLLAWTEQSLGDLPGSERLSRAVERSGVKLRVGYVPYLALFAAFLFGVVATIIGAPPGFALLAMLIGLLSPFVVLKIAAQRRTMAFDRQLPDVLATIASTMRAGHGLRTALRAIADDSAAPACEEFARVLGEERLGRPLDEAIAAMCERIGSHDLEYVATAVNVQSQTGGSLAGLFDTLSETVRERQRHARKVKALTSLGRMSAIVLVSMPIGLGALMTLISPQYMAPLLTTSTGHVLIGVCLTSMAIGALFLRQIVSVKF